MRYIRIINSGEIEPQALHLVGASSKRGDSTKIGQFGSGNKYALAYLLRNNYGVKIFSGLNEISVETKPEMFREQEFNVLFINGEKTSITSEMGKNWKFWQAIREIYCNAIDEGGHSIDLVQSIEPKQGVSQFYIDNKGEALEFMLNFNNYFAMNKRVLFECADGRILEKTGTEANLYRKGIKCFNSTKTSVYDYDFSEVAINEDRIAMYSWTLEEKMWSLIYQCTDKEVIRQVLCSCANSDFMESGVSDYSALNSSCVSKEFMEVMQDLKVAPKGMSGLLTPDEMGSTVILPSKVFESVRGLLKDDNVAARFKLSSRGAIFRQIERTLLHEETIRKAMDFLSEAQFEIPYEILLCQFDEKDIMGCAYEGKIYVSDICMEKGVAEVVNTIIEEYIHLKYDCEDKTRKMQTAIITEFISYMQKVNSYAI